MLPEIVPNISKMNVVSDVLRELQNSFSKVKSKDKTPADVHFAVPISRNMTNSTTNQNLIAKRNNITNANMSKSTTKFVTKTAQRGRDSKMKSHINSFVSNAPNNKVDKPIQATQTSKCSFISNCHLSITIAFNNLR